MGYALAPPDVIEALGRVRNAFDVNAVAQAAAVAALGEADAELPRRVDEIRRERARVDAALRSKGHRPLPSEANFLLVPYPSAEAAQTANSALLAQGIIVRPTGPFGAPAALRITIGLPSENDALLAAIGDAPLSPPRS